MYVRSVPTARLLRNHEHDHVVRAALLARPVHERQTLVVVPDQDLRGIEQLVSTQQAEELAIEQSAWTDQIPQWLELAVGRG
jgi:hypothetical protein